MISFANFQNPLGSAIVSYLLEYHAVVLIQCGLVLLFLLKPCSCLVDLFYISGYVSYQCFLCKVERKSWRE